MCWWCGYLKSLCHKKKQIFNKNFLLRILKWNCVFRIALFHSKYSLSIEINESACQTTISFEQPKSTRIDSIGARTINICLRILSRDVSQIVNRILAFVKWQRARQTAFAYELWPYALARPCLFLFLCVILTGELTIYVQNRFMNRMHAFVSFIAFASTVDGSQLINDRHSTV